MWNKAGKIVSSVIVLATIALAACAEKPDTTAFEKDIPDRSIIKDPSFAMDILRRCHKGAEKGHFAILNDDGKISEIFPGGHFSMNFQDQDNQLTVTIRNPKTQKDGSTNYSCSVGNVDITMENARVLGGLFSDYFESQEFEPRKSKSTKPDHWSLKKCGPKNRFQTVTLFAREGFEPPLGPVFLYVGIDVTHNPVPGAC